MYYFVLDASALVKRYHQEVGSDVVNHLLDELLDSMPEGVAVSALVISETIAVLSRHRKAGRIPGALFERAAARVLLDARAMDFQSVDNDVILASIPLISRHNINASDALYLHQALNLHRLLRLMGHELVLLASDRRLLRAAEKEDLAGLNPEEAKTAGVEVFLRPQESGI